MTQSHTNDPSNNTGSTPFPYAHTGLGSTLTHARDRAILLGVIDNPATPVQSTCRPSTVLATGNNENLVLKGLTQMNADNNNNGSNNGSAPASVTLSAEQFALLMSQVGAKKKKEGPFIPTQIDVYAAKKKNADGSLSEEANGDIVLKLGTYSKLSLNPIAWAILFEHLKSGLVEEMVKQCIDDGKAQTYKL